MALGDHIYLDRGVYSHHGVDEGNGWVIHFASIDGTKSGASIRRARIEDFAAGGRVLTRSYGARLSPGKAVERARSMLGASGYDLFSNNCEHFATWCVADEHSSAQVESATAGAGVVGVGAVVPQAGVAVVASLGEAAMMSGPNMMSGLASVGGTVVGGLVVLGATSGLLAGGAMCVALRDKATLPTDERQARRIGRYGAVGGGVAGVALGVHAVGAMGVAGYSAAGLTSGLAAFGGLVGAGMSSGVLLACLLPVLLAVTSGWLLYKAAQWALAPQGPGTARTASVP
jgi:hypothetical protein